MNCGLGAQFASQIADANPGDALQFKWLGGGGQNWPHNTGPMLTYMTSCGNSDCTNYNSSSSEWFKIEQVARVSSGGAWAQLAVSEGLPANVTLPSTLAPGNYLLRHEILGLQGAVSVGGAEFYIACSNLKVGGSQTGGPTQNELVQFPGVGGWSYNDTEPGIYDPNVYDPSAPYIFPGPPVAAFAGGDAANTSVAGEGSGSAGSGSTSTSGAGGPDSSSSTSPQSICKLQRRTTLVTEASTFAVKTHVRKRRNLLTGLFGDLRFIYKGSN
ncbi:glycoside hydrolase family 61 protein [Collybiopsis luxurians FD-317 M1]|uniref:AA9 family lytic polysaccharide monooxygenase n=1 Tax=Collybiopsis luxurians FD-317 M1 TaxID=944289 RepID=A0A0D0CW81_9AGAR|nr:glycoside hydrolase family 61 protein [Collybiopsis luxurians FD-317 M1]